MYFHLFIQYNNIYCEFYIFHCFCPIFEHFQKDDSLMRLLSLLEIVVIDIII